MNIILGNGYICYTFKEVHKMFKRRTRLPPPHLHAESCYLHGYFNFSTWSTYLISTSVKPGKFCPSYSDANQETGIGECSADAPHFLRFPVQQWAVWKCCSVMQSKARGGLWKH